MLNQLRKRLFNNTFRALRKHKHGYQTVMVAGGAEELCPTESAVFDTLFATSLKNEDPKSTPRPYDSDRDGLVIGEGAGTLAAWFAWQTYV